MSKNKENGDVSNVELFMTLREDIKRYSALLGRASDKIRNESVSKYPVFVLSQEEIPLGVKMVKKGGKSGKWNVHASTLEEFVAKNLVEKDKVDEFIKAYKDPHTFLCLFVLSELGAKFIFLPRVLEN